ncbi:sterol desaturase family protein [Flavitalea sp. BT771]|uniref:sterol desaturase family protein n=1 Tax=Flavitalea sp. BT771 TaxID=3063329 RepID=UPI0026E20CDC|nr:sterol desaturase family protein [Flavitalea sp. BT771]MDO6432819.1 sterol desaturase family protein [Flavitalea sp. BT771]MDV6221905.1 sterol desaturase family protein [Flavitalea sp. BT771]
MIYIVYVLVTLAVFVLMELVAWATHRWVMHGFLWVLHRDHHEPHDGKLEKNDWFALFFSIPSIGCCYLGNRSSNPWLICVGLGILLYGIAYFLAHDVIVHQRVKWFCRSRNRYIRQLRWAHKMHHKHLERKKGESFGFLFVEKKYRDKIKNDEELQQKS